MKSLINLTDPRISHAAVRRIAKATPRRLTEQAKPGPVTIYVAEPRAMNEQQRPRMPVMSTPPCLRDNTTEAGRQRAREHKMARFSVHVYDHNIGPAHDPYGQTELTVRNKATGWLFLYVHNGLGMERYEVRAPGNKLTHSSMWHDHDKGRDAHREECNSVCLQMVGITPDEAQAWHDETYTEDLMGRAMGFSI